MKIPDQPLRCQNLEEWRLWLQANHSAQKEAWLAIRKKNVAAPGLSYEEAVEEALCFGWIDGAMRPVAAEFYILRFSSRKRGSVWSASNQKRVERLMAQGRMAEAGLAKVREAKESGEWEAAIRCEEPSSLPEDLRRGLDENPAARANFEKFPASYKKQIFYWIASAKREETRQRRIREAVEQAARNERRG